MSGSKGYMVNHLQRKKQSYYSYKIEEKHVKYIMKVLKKNNLSQILIYSLN